MMTLIKILKSGQLPNAKTAAYTVPAGRAAVIKAIVCVNIDVANRDVKIYVKQAGGASVSIWEYPQTITTLKRVVDLTPITLAAGDAIEWEASAATAVDGNIFGVETAAQ